jgi:hypothetical protein
LHIQYGATKKTHSSVYEAAHIPDRRRGYSSRCVLRILYFGFMRVTESVKRVFTRLEPHLKLEAGVRILRFSRNKISYMRICLF